MMVVSGETASYVVCMVLLPGRWSLSVNTEKSLLISLPVNTPLGLTMPAGDITHPVPDLTGYIPEGQILLSPELHGRGLYPPIDVLGSLSRLMRKGAGEGLTRGDHPRVAAELVAAVARARQVSELADLVGDSALSDSDRSFLRFQEAFDTTLLDQPPAEDRPLPETLERAWRALSQRPRSELTMVSDADSERSYP